MVKLENVLGGSVQFHFNIAEKSAQDRRDRRGRHDRVRRR